MTVVLLENEFICRKAMFYTLLPIALREAACDLIPRYRCVTVMVLSEKKTT